MASDFTDEEMVAGYFDGRDPDSPAPSANRSASYRHGFQSGRDDLAKQPSARASVRRKMAADAIAADDTPYGGT
jgi:hypothetical protein